MVEPAWPQPSLSARKRIVNLIEEGKNDDAVELLHKFYETPRAIKVLTPRQMLESTDPCVLAQLPSVVAFSFKEWEELKEAFPSEYEETEKNRSLFGLKPEDWGRGMRIGWFTPSISEMGPEMGECPDLLIISQEYISHPAVTLHEFSHLLWHYLKIPPLPETGPITKPETWDRWTRDFLTDVKPEPWYPWIIPALLILTFIGIPITWAITWTTYPQK